MFRTSNFDKLLDKATSNLRLDPDWPTILQICDLIRQNDCSPKYAVTAVKKKLYSQNPHQAMFALLTLESVVKNCGSGIHDEVASKVFCEMLRDLVKTTQHENLRTKVLELIQAWGFAFRNNPKYRAVQDTVNILKAEGFKFPPLKESDAMFSADTAPEWADGEVCHRCRVAFSLMVRRHHCRACGQVFCQQCSSKTSTLPKFGIEKEVRVCDACYDKVSRPPTSSAKIDIVDTSSDYGPAQKRPPGAGGKTAEELQEEEELQLALALSQSEAEQKEKERRGRYHIAPDPTPHHPTEMREKTAQKREEEELQLALALSQFEAESRREGRRNHSAPEFKRNYHSNVSPTPSSVSASPEHSTTTNSELSRYLDRNYWEQRQSRDTVPTAPSSHVTNETVEEYAKPSTAAIKQQDDDAEDKEIDEFVESLKNQVEIFVNRMKSNSSRGRSIANDTSVQTLFMNITAMHSRLLRYIQQQDDKRVYLESLQDKVNQVRDSRAALDTLRAEHAARLAAQAEAAERQRQMQMAAKLQAMRKKKHEYLQYQRQLALQRVQEQEREMQMRQEQQKHQYMMSANSYYMPGASMAQYQPGYPGQPMYANPQFHPQMMTATSEGPMSLPGQPQPNMLNQMATISQSMPQVPNTYAMSTSGMTMSQAPLTQTAMNQPNMRPVMSQQLPIQQQMMLQQMHQMRIPSQAGMHQMMPQNMTNGMLGQQNIPQQNGQTALQKQNLPNQPQQPNTMMPPMTSGQQSIGQTMINPSNPMLGMQMQNMRMPMMQGNQPNINQQHSGFLGGMQNQHNNQQPGQQAPNMQQATQMGLPGSMSMPSQSQNMQIPNNLTSSQSVQLPGAQVPQNQAQQMSQQAQQSAPVQHGLPAGQQIPNQQMMMQGQQILQGQNIPQAQQMHQQPMQLPGSQGQVPTGPQGHMPPGTQVSLPPGTQVQLPPGPQVQVTSNPQMVQGQQGPKPGAPGQQGPPQMPTGQMPQALPQGHQMQVQMPQQQTSQTPQMPQNIPGQPIKTQSQNFLVNTVQGQVNPNQQSQQVQAPVKSENNKTAELISFD